MKPRKLFVQEYYASTYRLHRNDEAPVLGPIHEKDLSNEHDAMAFIRRLRMDHADWLRLLHEMNALTANSRLSLYYSQCDVATLASGYHRRIRFYRFDERTYDFDRTDNHYPVINTAPGVSYHFVPSSILLLSDPNLEDINSFTTYEWQQAEQFLDTLALTDEQLATLIPGLKLRFGGKARPGATRKERFDCLRNALTGGEIVAVRVQESITPPKRRGPEDLPVEEYTPKPYTLGLHEEPGYEPNLHAGLHNQEELTPDRKTSAESFKPTRQVDMRNLSPEDKIVSEALDAQGWNDDKVEEILESSNQFSLKNMEEGEKLYGFDTGGQDISTLDNKAYWLDKDGFADVEERFFKQGHWDKEGVKDYLALPCFNRANAMMTAELTESQTVVKSTIGKATELLKYTGGNGYTTGTLGKIMGEGGSQISPNARKLALIPGK